MGQRDRFDPYLYHCDYFGLLGTGFIRGVKRVGLG